MVHLRFDRDHTRDIGEGRSHTYPAGWKGHVDDDVAAKAVKAGDAVVIGETKDERPADVVIPEDWDTFNAADSLELARRLGAGADVKVKADAQDFIEKTVQERAPKT